MSSLDFLTVRKNIMCISVFQQTQKSHLNEHLCLNCVCNYAAWPAYPIDWELSDSATRMHAWADWRLFSCVWTNLSSEDATVMKSRCRYCCEISCHAVFGSACGCFFFFCIWGAELKWRKQVDICLKDYLLVSCRWKEAPLPLSLVFLIFFIGWFTCSDQR